MSEKICSRCVMDSSVPGICFDENGVCNYCRQFDQLCKESPIGEAGKKILLGYIEKAKEAGKKRKYDVLIGISGGTDSTYLLHIAMENGLRPLGVHIDNGYDTEISTSNMQKMIQRYGIDVINIKVDQNELNQVFLAFMKAGLPWIDGPTDVALVSLLYRTAVRYGIKYIWVGKDFRTEGRQPDEWTHIDSRLTGYVWRHFGKGSMKHFANITPWDMFHWWFIRKIKIVCPLNLLDYNKKKIKLFLAEKYGWQDYGGHHHENLFTKFALTVWLYEKFGIDKRKVTFSACVRSGEMSRDDALLALREPPCSEADREELKELVCKRLNLSQKEFSDIMQVPNKTFHDYPSYFPLYLRFRTIINYLLKAGVGFKPMMTYSMEQKTK